MELHFNKNHSKVFYYPTTNIDCIKNFICLILTKNYKRTWSGKIYNKSSFTIERDCVLSEYPDTTS